MKGSKLVSDILTGPDGKTWCTSSVAFMVTLVVFLALAIYSRDRFDPQAFGIGVGGLISAFGVAKRLEPKEMYGGESNNDSPKHTD